MKVLDEHAQSSDLNQRARLSRRRTRQLVALADNLSMLGLKPDERDRSRAERMLHASQYCISRGQYRLTQQLLSRAYAICTRLQSAELAIRITSQRVRLENILRNAAAMRLWESRHTLWSKEFARHQHRQEVYRRIYYRRVLSIHEPQNHVQYDEYISPELRHVLRSYHLCTHGRYHEALQHLHDIQEHASRCVYLQDEVRWLRFRIACSTQDYRLARIVCDDMHTNQPHAQRLRESALLASLYVELVQVLYDQEADACFQMRLATAMNSFQALMQEQAGLYLSLYVYELTRLVIEEKFINADRRLASLRVRCCRKRSDGDASELRIYLRIISYILGTIHKHKREFPHHLYRMFHMNQDPVQYCQQGIVPYSELAYRLLRRMGYR